MLSLPSAHNEVRLDTSSIHVKLFVDLLQGRIPNFGKLPEPFSVSVVLHLCAQYECISVKHVCLSLLRSYLRTPYSSPHVLEVLCAAVEQQDVDLICDSLAQFEELERIHSVGFDGPEGYALWYESLENRVGANGWDLACLPLEQFQRIPHNVFLAYYRVKTQNLYAQESGNKDLNWTRVGKVVRGVLSWGDPCGVAQVRPFCHKSHTVAC